MKTVVKIKKIIDNLPSDYQVSIIIIRNNLTNRKIPNLFDFSSLSTFTDNYSFFTKKPFIYYNKCSSKKQVDSKSKLPLLYFYNIPFKLIGEISPQYKVKCDFFINGKKSFIFSDIGNVQSIKRPYNLDTYDILDKDYLILNGYDSSKIKPEKYADFYRDNDFVSEVEIREYLLTGMISILDQKVENNAIFNILKTTDRIQNIYLSYFDDLLNILETKAGKTTTKAYQNSILINSESIKSSNYPLTNQINFSKSYITDSFENYDHFSPDIYSSNTDNSHLLQFNSFILSLPYDAIDLSKRIKESTTKYLTNYGLELKNQIDFLNNNYDYFNLIEMSNFNKNFAESVSSMKESVMDYVFKKDNNYILELPKQLPTNLFNYNLLQIDGKNIEINSNLDINTTSYIYNISSTEEINIFLQDKVVDNNKYLYTKDDILVNYFNYIGNVVIESGQDYFTNELLSEYFFDYLENDTFLLFNRNLVGLKKIEKNKIFLNYTINSNEEFSGNLYVNKNPRILNYPGITISYDSINLLVTIPFLYFDTNWNNIFIEGLGDVSNRNEIKKLSFENSFIKLSNNGNEFWYMIKKYSINSSGDYILELYQTDYMINTNFTQQSLILIDPLKQINNKINPYGNLVESSGFPFDYSMLLSLDKEFFKVNEVKIINGEIIRINTQYDNNLYLNQWILIKKDVNGKVKNYYGKIVNKIRKGNYQISPKCNFEDGVLYSSDKTNLESIKIPFQIKYKKNKFYFNFILVNNDYSHLLIKNIFNEGDLVSYGELSEMRTFKIEKVDYLDEDSKLTDNVVGLKIDGLDRSNLIYSKLSAELFTEYYAYGKIIKGEGIPTNTKIIKIDNGKIYLSNYLESSWTLYNLNETLSEEKSINIITKHDFLLRPEFEYLSFKEEVNKDNFIWIPNSRIGNKISNKILLPFDFEYDNENLFDYLGNKEFYSRWKRFNKK